MDELFYKKLREKYKPNRIKCLIIAESPPESEEGRFFYNPECEKWDYLFKSIMEVIFGHVKGEKGRYLEKFKDSGFYLIDAVDKPINKKSQSERNRIIRENIENKIKEINELISKDTPIILIKKNIFEIFYKRLYNRFRVYDKSIPFPSHGRQKEFKEKFREALRKFELIVD